MPQQPLALSGGRRYARAPTLRGTVVSDTGQPAVSDASTFSLNDAIVNRC